MPNDTETNAIAALALDGAARYDDIDRGVPYLALLPEGHTAQVIEVPDPAAPPKRSSGTVAVYDAPSFLAAVAQRRDGPVALYADEDAKALVAILNDDLGSGTSAEHSPGWRDYRVSLTLRARPEWTFWTDADRKLVDQDTFARHIEDGIKEIAAPPGAVMLDVATQFEATSTVRFRERRRLDNGTVQLMHDEDLEAKVAAGAITVPPSFRLLIAPYYGVDPFDVEAAFRYTLKGGELRLGYQLDRPDEVERAAFRLIREQVEAGLPGDVALSGPAPVPSPLR